MWTRSHSVFVVSILGFLSWFAVEPALAQPRPDAAQAPQAKPSASTDYKQLVNSAVEAFETEDYARARELFEQAHAIQSNARVLRGLGISALHLKRFTDAKRELTESLSETKQPLTASQREAVTALLSWIQDNLATLHLSVRPSDAEVELDGRPVTDSVLVVTPGKHRVVVHSDGFIAEQRAAQVVAAQALTLSITLSPRAPEPARKPAVSARDAATAVAVTEPSPPAPLPVVPSESIRRDRDESSSVFESWWFWTAVGVAIAGGVATAVAFTQPSSTKSYAQGGLGGVLKPLELERTP